VRRRRASTLEVIWFDYAPSAWLNLHLGYRSLNFNYAASDSNLGFNVHLRGPILAGTFRF
jgi:hypothetical protein